MSRAAHRHEVWLGLGICAFLLCAGGAAFTQAPAEPPPGAEQPKPPDAGPAQPPAAPAQPPAEPPAPEKPKSPEGGPAEPPAAPTQPPAEPPAPEKPKSPEGAPAQPPVAPAEPPTTPPATETPKAPEGSPSQPLAPAQPPAAGEQPKAPEAGPAKAQAAPEAPAGAQPAKPAEPGAAQPASAGSPAAEADPPGPAKAWRLHGEVAGEMLTQMGLPPDVTTENGDTRGDDLRIRLLFDGSYRFELTSEDEVTGAYGIYQSFHLNQSNLNLLGQTGRLHYVHRFGDGISVAGSFDYTHYILNSDSFIDRQQESLEVAFPLLEAVTAQVALNSRQLQFLRDTDQNAFAFGPSATLTWALPGGQDNLSLGYAYERDDAHSASFSYDANRLTLGAEFFLTEKDWVTLWFGYTTYRFDARDRVEIDQTRSDDIHATGIRYTHVVAKGIAAYAQYSYVDSESTVLRQDYESQGVTVGVTFEY
ncbi:MAG: hypothetical protein HYZ53_01540 [Planctomycetes bacterium]|nr:hypothetical protein [Planctomycetota bacterium]